MMEQGQQIYSEKEILGDALTAEKTATEHYNMYANECVHENVRSTILHCLEQEHSIQQEVFQMMHGKGFYPTPAAQEQKVQEAKQKFSQCAGSFAAKQR